MDIWQLVLTFIGAVGGVGIVVIGIANWLAGIIANQIETRTNAKYERELQGLRHQHEEELEKLRASIAETAQIKSRATDMLDTTYITAHARIADAALSLEKGIGH